MSYVDGRRPIRVLQVIGTLNRGGAETWLVNAVRSMNSEKFDTDFLVFSSGPDAYDDQVKQVGAKIIRLPPPNPLHPLRSVRQLLGVLRDYGPYDVVHAHILHSSAYALLAARIASVKIRIAHSHSSATEQRSLHARIYYRMLRWLIGLVATRFLACGKEAGRYLFGDLPRRPFNVIHNGVNLEAFGQTDSMALSKLRSGLGIPESCLIIGMIARMEPVKNHRLAIDIAGALSAQRQDFRLLMVGDGSLRGELEDQAGHGAPNQIVFLGVRADVPEILKLVDVVILPSHFEGFPVILVEAQVAGCKVLVSDQVSEEVDLGLGLVTFVPIYSGVDDWVSRLGYMCATPGPARAGFVEDLQGTPFDIRVSAGLLERYYGFEVGL